MLALNSIWISSYLKHKKCESVTGPAITSAEDSKYNVKPICLEEENSAVNTTYVSKFK